METVKAPNPFRNLERPWLFLAGSIEMGLAELWQKQIENALAEYPGTILNPRRDDWDSSWVQSIENLCFYQQVKWELDGLDAADIVLLYFQPGTKSPISLLELGLYAGQREKLIVCCPEGFWRKGNVDIVCERYKVTEVPGLDDAEMLLEERLNAYSFNTL